MIKSIKSFLGEWSQLPLSDPINNLSFDVLAGCYDIGRVSWVRSSQVQVMSCAMKKPDIDISVAEELVSDATSSPRIQVTVRENNVGNMAEVLVGVAATKGIKCPVKLRCQPVSCLALSDIIVWGIKLGVEHVCLSILVNGHNHLIARLVVPPVNVKAFQTKVNFSAVDIASRVLKDVEDDGETAEQLGWSGGIREVSLCPGAS